MEHIKEELDTLPPKPTGDACHNNRQRYRHNEMAKDPNYYRNIGNKKTEDITEDTENKKSDGPDIWTILSWIIGGCILVALIVIILTGGVPLLLLFGAYAFFLL